MLGLGNNYVYNPATVWIDNFSLFCDATGDYAAMTTTNISGYTFNDGTVSAWVKGNTFGADGMIFDLISTTSGHAIYVFYDDSEEAITFVRTDGDSTSTLTHTITDSNITASWYHIAVTWQYSEPGGRAAGFHTLYVNGSNEATNTTALSLDGTISKYFIGRNAEAANTYWDGYINDIALFSGALSAGNVLDVYNAGKPKNETNRDNLQCYVTFDEHLSSSNTIIESSPNSNVITIYNAVIKAISP